MKSKLNDNHIVGYSNKLSVQPSEELDFMISCTDPKFNAEVVRLIHGDNNPNGPGHKDKKISSNIDGYYDGRIQTINSGSYIKINDSCYYKEHIHVLQKIIDYNNTLHGLLPLDIGKKSGYQKWENGKLIILNLENNGLKILLDGQSLVQNQIDMLKKMLINQDFTLQSPGKIIPISDIQTHYLNTICKRIQLKRPLTVVIDCGNGVVGPTAKKLFQEGYSIMYNVSLRLNIKR